MGSNQKAYMMVILASEKSNWASEVPSFAEIWQEGALVATTVVA
jgi:6-phosphogluconate dehydrogenase